MSVGKSTSAIRMLGSVRRRASIPARLHAPTAASGLVMPMTQVPDSFVMPPAISPGTNFMP
jgi:hypothetical protein